MRAKLLGIAALLCVGGASMSVPVAAATIDNTSTDVDTMFWFGPGNTETFGQVFTAPGSQLTSFSMWLRDIAVPGGGTLDLRGYIAEWNPNTSACAPNCGFGIASNILFESVTQTMNAVGTLQQFTFNPNLILTSGNLYVAFLSISNLPEQPQNGFGMPQAVVGKVDGNFVSLSSGLDPARWTSQQWSHQETDVWLRASFLNPVPIPAALPLFATGLGMLGLLAWRRKRKDAAESAA